MNWAGFFPPFFLAMKKNKSNDKLDPQILRVVQLVKERQYDKALLLAKRLIKKSKESLSLSRLLAFRPFYPQLGEAQECFNIIN
jgi:hypothetical protein